MIGFVLASQLLETEFSKSHTTKDCSKLGKPQYYTLKLYVE